uniref:Uncharacterized protein n=1 Tax=Oryza nivara TaxID=4536 RepID=A0A0E0J3N1_ORYNI
MQLMLTFCTGPLLFAVLLLMVYLKQLAAAACVDVLIIYLCRFLLLRGIIFSGDGKLRFRVKVAIGFLYISLSAILFYLSAAVMALPPWGAVAMWGMALVATELGNSFLCPYSCRCIARNNMDLTTYYAILLIVEVVFAFFFLPYSCGSDVVDENIPHV